MSSHIHTLQRHIRTAFKYVYILRVQNSYKLLYIYIEDVTCPRVDMNSIFEWSTRYLTNERSERVRYRVEHEKIKFISISEYVIFLLKCENVLWLKTVKNHELSAISL